jgi:hypothetical protein
VRLRKGDLARVIAPDKRGPNDLIHEPFGFYLYTPEERAEIQKSWLGLSDLDPSSPPYKEYVNLPEGEIVQVIKARTQVPRTNGRARGWCLVLSTRMGKQIFIQRKHIQPVGDTTSEKERET